MRDVMLGGDAREVLRPLEDASVDAVVTDPPYALTSNKAGTKGFMSAAWDNGSVAHDSRFWAEALRVAKPGAFLVAFGGTRTYHRLACAVEDAGWDLRDMINWLYASGFPKSRSCLKPAHEPIVLAKAPGPLQPLQIDACRVAGHSYTQEQWTQKGARRTTGATYGQHRGSDTPLPAGRWPPNLLLSHVPPAPDGTGGCRPAGVRRVPGITGGTGNHAGRVYGPRSHQGQVVQHYADSDGYEQVDGWQCVDGCPIKALDEQAGPRTSGGSLHERGHVHGVCDGTPGTGQRTWRAPDRGSASRFFPTFAPEPEHAVPWMYCAKASRRERNAGLDGLPEQSVDRYGECGQGSTPQQTPRVTRMEGNHHPTVKPIALMQWLVRLVTPPGDAVVLDPFCGSGSTLVACVREGIHFIGIDAELSYVEIARRRVAYEQEQQTGPLFAGIAT